MHPYPLWTLCDQLADATKKAPTAKARQWAERLRSILYRASGFHAEVVGFSTKTYSSSALKEKYGAYSTDTFNGLPVLEDKVRILAHLVLTSFLASTTFLVQEPLKKAYQDLQTSLKKATNHIEELQYAPSAYCVSPLNTFRLKAFPFYKTEPPPVVAAKNPDEKAPPTTHEALAATTALIQRIETLEIALNEVQTQLRQLKHELSSSSQPHP